MLISSYICCTQMEKQPAQQRIANQWYAPGTNVRETKGICHSQGVGT